jgi:hypothetical protein
VIELQITSVHLLVSNAEISVLVTSQKADLEVNAERRKRMFITHEENEG